jgi:hypothetical protein
MAKYAGLTRVAGCDLQIMRTTDDAAALRAGDRTEQRQQYDQADAAYRFSKFHFPDTPVIPSNFRVFYFRGVL